MKQRIVRIKWDFLSVLTMIFISRILNLVRLNCLSSKRFFFFICFSWRNMSSHKIFISHFRNCHRHVAGFTLHNIMYPMHCPQTSALKCPRQSESRIKIAGAVDKVSQSEIFSVNAHWKTEKISSKQKRLPRKALSHTFANFHQHDYSKENSLNSRSLPEDTNFHLVDVLNGPLRLPIYPLAVWETVVTVYDIQLGFEIEHTNESVLKSVWWLSTDFPRIYSCFFLSEK